MVTQPFHLAVLATILAVGCVTDLTRRRIPNAVVGLVLLAGLLAQWREGGAMALASGAVAGLAVGVLLFGLWSAGKVGGGDVKLVAAVSVWVGPERLPMFLVVSGLAAAVLGLVVLATSRTELQRALRVVVGAPPPAGTAAAPRRTVPVAVAVTAAAFALLTGRFR
jgi:prepilin peptidase CpaA